jgi:predicted DsbA family dithiol-disulfide isomerase
MDDFFKKTAVELKLDPRAREADAYGPGAMAMFRQDEADAKKYEANASPTLVINGVKSRSVYKGKDEIRKAICSAFSEQPAACH